MSNKKRGLIYGVGINDADYLVKGNGKRCPFYVKWGSMLGRCYSSKWQRKNPRYKDCTVAPEWHSFMNFKRWMEKQDWHGKELDKDIISLGNEVYGPETCVFVSRAVNTLLNANMAMKGKWPTGVCFSSVNNGFTAKFKVNGVNKNLGTFGTPEAASKVYRNAKRLHILTIACCEPDIRVKQGLYRHSELLR